MAKGNAFNGEILHCNAVRLRVTGSGNLQQFLRSLDDVNEEELIDVAMASSTAIQPTTLANFNSQRIYLEIGTEEIDEVFTVSKIVLFVKPIFAEYPR